MTSLPPLPDEPVVLPAAWSDIWKMALTRPSVETFSLLSHAPGVTSRKAHIWIFLSALVGSILAGGFGSAVGTLLGARPGSGPSSLDLAILAPLLALFALALFIIGVGTALLCAHALGGKGIYPRLAYALATFVSPLLVIAGILSALPLVNVTNLLLVLYATWLSVVAVRGITRLTWPRALLALVLTIGVLVLLLAGFILATLPLFLNALRGGNPVQ